MIGLTESAAWATAIDLGGRHSASSAGFANTGGNIGGSISPTITPWIGAVLMSQLGLSENASWGWALRFAAGLCLLGSLLWIWIDAGERR
jgi:ACS family glucarate transporter-like MFS transporter